jgi:hypothetical protein
MNLSAGEVVWKEILGIEWLVIHRTHSTFAPTTDTIQLVMSRIHETE